MLLVKKDNNQGGRLYCRFITTNITRTSIRFAQDISLNEFGCERDLFENEKALIRQHLPSARFWYYTHGGTALLVSDADLVMLALSAEPDP